VLQAGDHKKRRHENQKHGRNALHPVKFLLFNLSIHGLGSKY
jgi:hypothetical protein